MDFLRQGKLGDTRWSGYLLMLFFIVLVFGLIGQLPMTIDALFTDKAAVQDGASPFELMEVFGRNKFFFYLMFPFALTFFTVLIAVKLILKRPWQSILTARDNFDWKRLLFAAVLLGVIVFSSLLYSIYTNKELQWNFNPTAFFPLLIIALIMVPLQTAAEEVVMRGFIFQVIGASGAKGWHAVAVTGVVFGLLHAANPEVQALGPWVISYYILTGLFLGIIVLMDDGLELAIGYHLVNNLFATLIVTNNWQAFRTDALFIDLSPPAFGWENFISLFLIQPLLLFIFSKRYKWTNWHQRLLQ
jgi:membrane protease YdiL (CAAX protease family)